MSGVFVFLLAAAALRLLWCALLSTGRSEHPVADLHEDALLGFGELGDAVELLLKLGRGPALARFPCLPDQLFDGHAEGSGDGGKGRQRHAAPAGLLGIDRLLGDAGTIGDRPQLFLLSLAYQYFEWCRWAN